MKKGNKKLTENLIPNKTSGNQNNIPSFGDDVLKSYSKELYLELLQYIKNLNIKPTNITSKEYIYRLASDLFETNNLLYEKYSSNLSDSINVLNKLSDEYQKNLASSIEKSEKELRELEEKLNNDIQEINEALFKFQQQAIIDSKSVENDFIPKANFLKYNKKINKDEYIKIVREINEHRINTNQKYLEIATDLSNINEQQQLKFKHSIEASIEKNNYDITVFNQEALEKTHNLEESLNEKNEKSKQFIQIKERKIITNSIELNELITKISTEYANRIKYAYVPYDIKENKLLDEQTENNQTYNSIETQVLEEFKTLLQQNDIEIDELRQKHRTFKEKYLNDIKEIKKTLNTAYQKDIYLLNRELSVAAKNYSTNKTKENKKLVKKLEAKKKKYIKEFNKEKKKKLAVIKKEYYIRELTFIEEFEKLRTKKSQCEAIKSSAMKNINYERVYHHERISNELKLNNFEKDSYTSTDHYEEIIDIYKNHKRVDIENEEIRYTINTEEVESYNNTINIKYQKDKIIAERDYNINLSQADLNYQKESINNRINYFNVKTMLEIQKENIINKYEVLFSTEKMDFERIKNIFYNNCDNIQYELYKADTELNYKLIDTDLEFEINNAEIEKNHLKVIYNINRRKNSINKINDGNELRLKLYLDRLEIEKNILSDTYKFFNKSLENIIGFESYLYSTIPSLSSEEFENNKKQLIIILEYLRKIKFMLTETYYNQSISIIENRSNFEKEIRFKKQITDLQKEYDEFNSNSKYRIEKNSQTINSYKNTINTSLKALTECKRNIFKNRVKLLFNLFNKKQRTKYEIELKNSFENKIIIKKQITANKKNVNKLKRLEITLYRERTENERKFKIRFDAIEKNQFNETKIYSELIDLIKTQSNKLNTIITDCGLYTSLSRYTYKVLNQTSTSIQKINHSLVVFANNYFDIHLTAFNNKLINHHAKKSEMYRKNHEKYLKEYEKSIAFALKELTTNKTTLQNSYKSKKDSLLGQIKNTKQKLLQDLKKLNNEFNQEVENHNKKMSLISKQKEDELACHNANFEMYIEIYNKTNSKIINDYLADIKKIKEDYQNVLESMDSKYKESLKRIKTQHFSNETLKKTNINNIEIEYKEKINLTLGKIKRINQEERKAKIKQEESKNERYSLYLQNQRKTRKEFSLQLSSIDNKCIQRIKIQKKEFKKEFKKKND